DVGPVSSTLCQLAIEGGLAVNAEPRLSEQLEQLVGAPLEAGRRDVGAEKLTMELQRKPYEHLGVIAGDFAEGASPRRQRHGVDQRQASISDAVVEVRAECDGAT